MVVSVSNHLLIACPVFTGRQRHTGAADLPPPQALAPKCLASRGESDTAGSNSRSWMAPLRGTRPTANAAGLLALRHPYKPYIGRRQPLKGLVQSQAAWQKGLSPAMHSSPAARRALKQALRRRSRTGRCRRGCRSPRTRTPEQCMPLRAHNFLSAVIQRSLPLAACGLLCLTAISNPIACRHRPCYATIRSVQHALAGAKQQTRAAVCRSTCFLPGCQFACHNT